MEMEIRIRHDHYHYDGNKEILDEILKSVLTNHSNLKTIMATITELTTKVDELQTALDAEQEQIKAAIDALQATVDELRQNQTDGGTAEERQALADKLDGIKTDLEGTIPDEQG